MANILIIGAGTVGEFAARSAKALGCSVKIFDTSLHKLRRGSNWQSYCTQVQHEDRETTSLRGES